MDLSGNTFAVGGIVAIAFGALLALLRGIPSLVATWLLGAFSTSVEILEKDESYRWVNTWLAEQLNPEKTRNLSVVSYSGKGKNRRHEAYFAPGIGIHRTTFMGRLVIVKKNREEKSGGLMGNITSESMTLRVLSRDTSVVRQLIERAQELSTRPKEGYAELFIPRWGSWSSAGLTRTRSMNTIIFSKKQFVIDDLETFYNSEERYHDRGIPYQRGYLLYGAPGNGKSSFIRAIAGRFGLGIYLVDLKDKRMSDLDLQWLVADIPPKSLLLLEDIDSVISNESVKSQNDLETGLPETEGKEDSGVTLSGLLNALDGIVSNDSGRVVVMTTNHPENLPDNLIRHGRIDVKLEFPNVNNETLPQVVKMFYPDADCSWLSMNGTRMSFASLQDVLMTASDSKTAIDNVAKVIHSKVGADS